MTFEEAKRLAVPTVLVTAALEATSLLLAAWDVVVDVPRGRAGRFALHGVTLVAIEALVLSLGATDRDRALRTLDRLGRIRNRLEDRGR